jgi:hypothetical protein
LGKLGEVKEKNQWLQPDWRVLRPEGSPPSSCHCFSAQNRPIYIHRSVHFQTCMGNWFSRSTFSNCLFSYICEAIWKEYTRYTQLQNFIWMIYKYTKCKKLKISKLHVFFHGLRRAPFHMKRERRIGHESHSLSGEWIRKKNPEFRGIATPQSIPQTWFMISEYDMPICTLWTLKHSGKFR